eukprot:TRINITY_DN1910_c0_g1_i2.p1 TRINITY_DN1910_c0_g1~~TRINITY_DN1910_c0_g1_i2.p1  ORF type:complete len:622 (+),score=181.15 TRINITY_DN1910_c0_g1_i2:157-2022(+)
MMEGWIAYFLVWIGLFLNFLLFLLLPIDISAVRYRNCLNTDEIPDEMCPHPLILIDNDALIVLWKIIYWSLFILCWTALPIWQSFCEVGQFTFLTKLKAAIRENIIFYGVTLAIGIVLFVFFAATGSINPKNVLSISIGAANAWGLLLMMCFLGYALVEIPKYSWLHSNDAKTLDIHQFHSVSYRDKHLKYRNALITLFKQIKEYSNAIHTNDPYRPFIDEIVDKCPIEYRDIRQGSGDNYPTYDKLVQLNAKLKQTVHKVKSSRSVYLNLIERAFELEDRIASYSNDEKRVRWTFKERREYKLGRVIDTLEWLWYSYVHSIFLRVWTVVCICMALMIIWSETFFNISRKFSVDLSIFSQVFNSRVDFSWAVQWLFIAFPLLYIATCSYWTLFRLKLFNYYQLIPHHHSSGSSLLFCAIYVSRLTPTIAYNFLMMIDDNQKRHAFVASHTAYYQVLRPEQENLGGFIEGFNTYFPIILILLCLGTLFDVYTKLVMSFCAQRFQKYIYHEEFSKVQVAEGQILIGEERMRKQSGEVYSIDEVSFGKRVGSKTRTKLGEGSKLTQQDVNANVERIKEKWLKAADEAIEKIEKEGNEEQGEVAIEVNQKPRSSTKPKPKSLFQV